MKSFVIDASLILNYLFTETPEVEQLVTKLLKQADKKKLTLLSTSLLPIEVANGLRFKLKEFKLTGTILAGFMALPIRYCTLSNTQLLETTRLAYSLGTTIYDTSYHLLAIAHHATFLTCDNKYYKQAKELGNIEYCG
ncbi:MAG: type II toxin-antitoxin system VapC family toxin [Microgenomates group bacterium]